MVIKEQPTTGVSLVSHGRVELAFYNSNHHHHLHRESFTSRITFLKDDDNQKETGQTPPMAAVVQKSSILLFFFLSVWISFFIGVSAQQGSDGTSLKKPMLGNIHLCMMNCGQCKEMYGDYFEGQRCAEFCLASYKPTPSSNVGGWAQPMPDCNEPETVDQFLKLSLMPQSDGPSVQQLIDDSALLASSSSVDSDGGTGTGGGGYMSPISQALMGSPYYSGRYAGGRKPSSAAQQNTLYNSRTGAEFKGHNQLLKNRKWKKRINGSSKLLSSSSSNSVPPSMPRWYFV